LAVAWLLSHPALTAAIVGARTAAQVEENVGAADWKPATADMRLIEELTRQHFPDQKGGMYRASFLSDPAPESRGRQ
jgi:aryl-alcohol dehydrogenase-like predicted oxidoreductase